jgi:hypothetical protein
MINNWDADQVAFACLQRLRASIIIRDKGKNLNCRKSSLAPAAFRLVTCIPLASQDGCVQAASIISSETQTVTNVLDVTMAECCNDRAMVDAKSFCRIAKLRGATL